MCRKAEVVYEHRISQTLDRLYGQAVSLAVDLIVGIPSEFMIVKPFYRRFLGSFILLGHSMRRVSASQKFIVMKPGCSMEVRGFVNIGINWSYDMKPQRK